MIRCKFTVTEIKDVYDAVKEVRMTTQYDPTVSEDQKFTKYTPSGFFVAVIDNPRCFDESNPDCLKVGKSFYLDLTVCPP